MYEWNEEEKKIDFSHNPFSMPTWRLEALALDQDPLDILAIKAIQYDIVCNGIELSSGAIRNHRPDVMRRRSRSPATARRCWSRSSAACCARFARRAAARRHRARHRPHRDAACGEENLREVVLFPMNQRAEDLLMGAPSEVTAKQLHPAQSAANSRLESSRIPLMAPGEPSSDDLRENARRCLSPRAASGKLEIRATKPLANQRDLALAYSPGVAARLRGDRRGSGDEAASLTGARQSRRGGLQRHGGAGPRQYRAAGAKPVMEGKAVLFKKFAGIDVFDIEIDARDHRRVVEMWWRRSSRPSAASISRTSRRRSASRSRRSSRSG